MYMSKQLVLPETYRKLREAHPRNDEPLKIGGCLWTVNNGGTRFYQGNRPNMTGVEAVKAIETIASVNGRMASKKPLLEAIGATSQGITGIESHYPNEVSEKNFEDAVKALQANGLVMSMMTPNLFYTYGNLSFGSTDTAERARAIESAERTVDLIYACKEKLGHMPMNVYWPGGEGWQALFQIDPVLALHLYFGALNHVFEYDATKHKGELRIAGEAKPNEPKKCIIVPTTADFLAGIALLKPEFRARMGVNPETAHEMLANLSPINPVATALAQGKLFHYHANWQDGLTWDQDNGVPVNTAMLWVIHLMKEYGFNGYIGLDMQARPESKEVTTVMFNSVVNLRLLEAVEKKIDWDYVRQLRQEGAVEAIEQYVTLTMMSKVLPANMDARDIL
jgi:sugar phosphate isomerase/epimerase